MRDKAPYGFKIDANLSIFEDDVTRFADVGLPALGAGMDAARHAAAGMGREGIDPLTVSEEELEGATDDATTAIQRQLDKMKEAADPIFAAAQKVDALREAQAKLITMQADTAASSEDLAEAELAVVEALFDAQGAMDDLSPSALNAAIASIQTATGKSKEEVMLLLEQLGILDGKTVTTYVDIRQRVVGGGSSAVGITPRTHTGGTVPGQYRGQEVLISAAPGNTSHNPAILATTGTAPVATSSFRSTDVRSPGRYDPTTSRTIGVGGVGMGDLPTVSGGAWRTRPDTRLG